MVQNESRRKFLRTAPLAAVAVTLPLAEKSVYAATGAPPATPEPYKVFSGTLLADAISRLHAKPGNENLYDSKALPITMVLTTEDKKSQAQFEYHEGRDHIFQILEGTTSYELGGTPKAPRSTKPGEWLAPASDGATSVTVSKGDMLLIPRGTPHKRSTADNVTFLLISITGVDTA